MESNMRKNAFDILRIFSALQVMLLHFNSFFYQSAPERHLAYRNLVKLYPGVVILFALSGFLVCASLERSKDMRTFFRKRILRIYPPLEGFATGSVNGALWTVFTEIQLYVVLALSYRRLKKLSYGGWSIVGLALLLCNLGAFFLQDLGHGIPKIIERLFLPYAIWFFLGVFLYMHRETFLPLGQKYVWPLFLLFTVYRCCPVRVAGYYTDLITSVCLPVLTVCLAYRLGEIHIRPDLSYHLFLYHWIVLNVLVHFDCLNRWSLARALSVFLAASAGVSLVSFYLTGYVTKRLQKQ